MALLGDPSFPIHCPKCGNESTEKLSRLKTSPKLVCSACGVTITIDAKQLKEGLASVEKSLDDFRKAISKSFKL